MWFQCASGEGCNQQCPWQKVQFIQAQRSFKTRHIWFQISWGQVWSCGQKHNGSWTGTLSIFQMRHQDTGELPRKQFRPWWTLFIALFSISFCERKEKDWDYPKAKMLSKPPTDAASHLKELFSLSPAKSTTEPTEGCSFCCALTYLIKPLRILWVTMKFHHHCKFGGRRLIQENYFQTQDLYSEQS